MARNADLIARRDRDIRKDHEKLRGQRNTSGGRKHTAEHVIYMLSERYYLSEERIRHIVYGK